MSKKFLNVIFMSAWLTVFPLIFTTADAAQDAEPAAPMGEIGKVSAPKAMEEEGKATNATPPASEDTSEWTLCPAPSEALSSVPAGPAEIQADIDRFTLCLDRAQLLFELEELQNKGAATATSVDQGAGLPINPVSLTSDEAASLMGEEVADVALVLSDYSVEKVLGTGGDLVAHLMTPEEEIQVVRVGDSLSDDSRVSFISATKVSITKDGEARTLKWSQ